MDSKLLRIMARSCSVKRVYIFQDADHVICYNGKGDVVAEGNPYSLPRQTLRTLFCFPEESGSGHVCRILDASGSTLFDVGRNVLFAADGQHDFFSNAKPAEFSTELQKKVLDIWRSQEIRDTMDSAIAAKLAKKWNVDRLMLCGQVSEEAVAVYYDRQGKIIEEVKDLSGDFRAWVAHTKGRRYLECFQHKAGGWACQLLNEKGKVLVDGIRVSKTGACRHPSTDTGKDPDIGMVMLLSKQWKAQRVFIVDSAESVRAFDQHGVLVQEGTTSIIQRTGLTHLVCKFTGEDEFISYRCELYDERDNLVRNNIEHYRDV